MSEYRKYGRLMSLGDHYLRHVSAMTTENLHDKGDIAAELAHRDKRIAELYAGLTQLQTECMNAGQALQSSREEAERLADLLKKAAEYIDECLGWYEDARRGGDHLASERSEAVALKASVSQALSTYTANKGK